MSIADNELTGSTQRLRDMRVEFLSNYISDCSDMRLISGR